MGETGSHKDRDGLRIYLFGHLELFLDERPLAVPPSAKARSLLGYLALHHDHAVPRERLLGLLWPARSESAARRALSQALWQLRQALGRATDRLHADRDVVLFAFGAHDTLDVEIFRQLCVAPWPPAPAKELHNLQQAIALYRADFLEEIYDDWALLERERLRELHLQALERLMLLCKQREDYESALIYARRLVTTDPLREEAHRELMRLYHLLGRSRAALQQYDRLRQLLAQELHTEPMPATTALAREIAQQAELTSLHLPTRPGETPPLFLEKISAIPLVGRQADRAALLTYLDEAIAGRGGTLLVEGEAGIGKSRLLYEIAQDARWRGVHILWGQCAEATVVTPYHPLAEAFRAALSPLRAEQLADLIEPLWLQEIGRLVPQLTDWLPDLASPAPLEPKQGEERFIEALVQTLMGMARIAPHLLILDDLQWVDEATLRALATLVRRLRGHRFLVLLAYREEEIHAPPARWELFRVLDRAAGGRRLRLRRLSQQDTAALIRRSLDASRINADFSAWVHRESEGNPLFILEILRSLHSEGWLRRRGRTWQTPWDEGSDALPEGWLPPTVEQVIHRRLRRLGEEARAVLNAAAVLGSEATFRHLREVTDLSEAQLFAAVNRLRHAHLLHEGSEGYFFDHEKARYVVYEMMSPDLRRTLHRRAAQALQHAVRRPATLAHHYELGGLPVEAARHYYRAADQALAMHAYAVARRQLERALKLAKAADLPDEERYEILSRYETTAGILGEREEQASALREMERLAQQDARRLAHVYRRRAQLLLQTSRYAEAEAAARRIFPLAQALDDPTIEADARVALGLALGIQGRQHEAIPHLEAAAQLAHAYAALGIESEAQAILASVHLSAGAYAQARTHAEAALTLFEAGDSRQGIAGILSTLGRICALEGKLEQAEVYYRRSLDICRTIGYRHGAARNLVNWGLVMMQQNRIGPALRLYSEALEIYRDLSDRRGEILVLANLADMLHTYLGDDETATRYAREALRLSEAIHNPRQGHSRLVLGRIALRRGRFADAERWLRQNLEAEYVRPWVRVETHQAMAALELARHHHAEALAHLERAEVISREAGSGAEYALPSILADRGQLLLELGRTDEALVATEQALASLHAGVERVYRLYLIYHRVLRALERHQEALQAIQEAHRRLEAALAELSAEQRAQSLARVPEHRAIVEVWQAYRVQRRNVRLPAADAPIGRPLHDDEWVTVTWTLSAPDDAAVVGKVDRRRHRLLRLLREAAAQGAAPTIHDLAEALKVGDRTIKRDLAALRAAGHPTPTRGHRRQS